jgi:hypothetical protein
MPPFADSRSCPLRAHNQIRDHRDMHLSTALEIGGAITVIAFLLLVLFLRGSSSPGLGSVSSQWLSQQHRAEDE